MSGKLTGVRIATVSSSDAALKAILVVIPRDFERVRQSFDTALGEYDTRGGRAGEQPWVEFANDSSLEWKVRIEGRAHNVSGLPKADKDRVIELHVRAVDEKNCPDHATAVLEAVLEAAKGSQLLSVEHELRG